MNNLFEIELKSILVIENGSLKKVEGDNVLQTTLVNPIEGNDTSLARIHAISLQDEQVQSFESKPFSERTVFKSFIKGTSVLEVELSAKEPRSNIFSFLGKVLQKVVEEGIGAISGGGASALVVGLLKGIAGLIFGSNKKEEKKDDKLVSIGKGEMPISNDTPEGNFVVQLNVPEDVVLERMETRDGERVLVRKTIPKGYTNAMVVYTIKKLEGDDAQQEDLIASQLTSG